MCTNVQLIVFVLIFKLFSIYSNFINVLTGVKEKLIRFMNSRKVIDMGDVDCLKNVLPSNIYDRLERAGINTLKEVLTLSFWDIRKLTHLNNEDVKLLKNVAVNCVNIVPITGNQICRSCTHSSSGSEKINNVLRGGFRKGTITEIYGESGSGKTQLAMQSAIHNWNTGCLYICTEDVFPVKRFEQIKQSLTNFDPSIDYGKNILIEHVTEPQDLLSCITVRLPKLLENKQLSLIVIDSIAAPYRCENTNYIQRAEDLRELAVSLFNLAQKNNIAVLCINQVTSVMDMSNECLPSLGLAWSNMISYRLYLRKTNKMYNSVTQPIQSKKASENNFIRNLQIEFAPDLPNAIVQFIIIESGLIVLD